MRIRIRNAFSIASLVALAACAGAPVKPGTTGGTVSAAGATAAAEKALPSAHLANIDTTYNLPVTTGLIGDVLKGDELTMQDGTEIRLIGIGTPIAAFSQRVGNYYGKGALDLARLLCEWKSVRLEYDKQTHDRKGRLLAYVYTADGKMLQEELLKNGFAFAQSFPPNSKFRDKFIALQKTAMAAKKGIWGLKPSDYPRENNVDKYVIEGVRVRKVINGKSVELDDGTIVRYIGIDANDSENRHLAGQVGHAAYIANKKLVEGKELTIEYDVEPKDPRGRDLAYVFVDGKLINEALVREGHAIVAVFPPNVKYLDVLFKAQEQAAKGNLGLWSGKEQ